MDDLSRSLAHSGAGLERDDHASTVLRMRRACTVAVVAWPAFGLVDWFIVEFVHPGRLYIYLLLRAMGLLPLLLSVVVTYSRRMPGPTLLRWTDAGTCMILSALISVSCIEFGGIVSPLILGVMLILMGRGALVTDRWQKAAVPIGLIALTHPATLGAMAMFDAPMAAQFRDPTALAGFALHQMFLFGAAAVTLTGGHMTWTLRRQIFETRSLGRYRLRQRIGAGGMGEVWAAHHQALKRDVAVKILRPEQRGDVGAIARFEREVRATAELSHPNTVRVFDYGVTEDGLWYYAMELLTGRDLHAIVSAEGPLEPLRAAHLIRQAAKALAEAHARGIVHRDVKPENLFVTSVDGEGELVKVLDFGLAKLARGERSLALTADGWAVGTPKWASPEVASGQDAGPASDVYGIGSVLYFLLCGAPPFDYPDVGQTIRAHLTQPPVPPSRRRAGIPPAIEEVVLRCLEKNPARRYAHAGELAAALKRAMLATGVHDLSGAYARMDAAGPRGPRAPSLDEDGVTIEIGKVRIRPAT